MILQFWDTYTNLRGELLSEAAEFQKHNTTVHILGTEARGTFQILQGNTQLPELLPIPPG